MRLSSKDCCVLNSGAGAWAFEPLAQQLSSVLGIEIAESPRRFNYVLFTDQPDALDGVGVFIPLEAMRLASDKRLLAEVFRRNQVPTPWTQLFDDFERMQCVVREHPETEWCMKYPTGCGASGHRLVTAETREPADWPKPFILQEFIRLAVPEVYRIYGAGGELFGWVVRRYPKGMPGSPWVAHASGAQYVKLAGPPQEAVKVAGQALAATGLLESFGCVDLLRNETGEWVVLEVGTDGLFNHVDRDLGDAELERELQQRVARAFWCAAERV